MMTATRRTVLILLAAPRLALAQATQILDQRHGSVRFTARHMGLFSTTARFERFTLRLALDLARTERTRVEADLDAQSIVHPVPGNTEMLRGPDYFDSTRFPLARYAGTGAPGGTAERMTILGTLTMRGVTRPLALEARLAGRDRAGAAFEATGELLRSEYGMVADRTITADAIRLAVSVQVSLAAG
ncbi:MAG TPA: YceI family protein [Acetobacteraceae bacterium]|nr:YceI family protein [Acetobacteraceae bacterium]